MLWAVISSSDQVKIRTGKILGKDYLEVNWPVLMTWAIGPKAFKNVPG